MLIARDAATYSAETSLTDYGITMIKMGHPNLALNKNVTVSSSKEVNGWNMVDAVDGKQDSNGWTARGWSSNNTIDVNHTEWVQVDFVTNHLNNKVDIRPRDDAGWVGSGFPIDYTIQVSTRYVKVNSTNLQVNANLK